jgi:two-component system response regulator GlrR
MKDYPKPTTASLGFGIVPKPKTPKQSAAQEVERKARVLIVDEDPAGRRLLSARLSAANYHVDSAESAHAALDSCVRSRPHLVISELHMQPMDGHALLKELKSRWPDLTVIILTAHGSIPEAVRATQRGAFSFLVKPVEKQELLGHVERAIASSTFTLGYGDWRANLVSRSQLMDERLSLANRAAAADAPVLLTGENGTGKELLARAIHAASPRRKKPFVVVDCQGADETLLAAQLFGRAPAAGGAGTGRAGAMESARGGTLLIDEIGYLPLRLQVALAKAVRHDMPGSADVRLICTTSRDLKKLMLGGEFRQDLYYQINILPIEIPPLGRRREDIPLLVSHFLEQATEPKGQKKLYTPKAIELLATSDWPGNVQQLFDLVKQNVALSQTQVITEELVKRSLGDRAPEVPSYHEARDRFTREYLEKNLQSTSGNVTQSARLAKRCRTDFYKLLARHRLQADDFKKPAAPGGPHLGLAPRGDSPD